MNILFIDTSSNKEIKVGVKAKGRTFWLKKPIAYQKAQVVLPMIDRVLRRRKLALKEIGAIEIATGPGSFTGLRVGIAVANTLSFVLKIPVNGKREIILPSY